MTTRRGFLGAILAAGVAPAVVKSGLLMPTRALIAPSQELAIPKIAVDVRYARGFTVPTALWPGVEAWYRKVYGQNFQPMDFTSLY